MPMLNKVIWFLAVFGVVAILAGLAGCGTNTPTTGSFPTPQISLGTPTLARTAEPTETQLPPATATPYDDRATQLVIDTLFAQAEAAKAEKELAEIAMTAEAGRSAARSTAEASERLTTELNARIILAYGKLTEEAQDKQAERDIRAKEIEIEARKTGMMEVAVWAALFLAFLGFSFVLLRAWRSAEQPVVVESAEDYEAPQVEKTSGNYAEVIQLADKDALILRGAAQRIAYHMGGLMSYRSVNEDCPDESKRILRAEWTEVRAVLIDKKYGMATEQVGGIQISQVGIETINKLLPR